MYGKDFEPVNSGGGGASKNKKKRRREAARCCYAKIIDGAPLALKQKSRLVKFVR